MPSRLFYLSSFDKSIFNYKGCLVSFFLSQCFIYIPVINANSVDPDQMPHSVCQCPIYGMLGLNGLTVGNLSSCVLHSTCRSLLTAFIWDG